MINKQLNNAAKAAMEYAKVNSFGFRSVAELIFGSGELTIVSTDGFALLRQTIKFPEQYVWSAKPSVCVTYETLLALSKSKSISELKVTDEFVSWRDGNNYLNFKTSSERFPDWNGILPKSENRVSVDVMIDAKKFNFARIFWEKDCYVKISTGDSGGLIVFTGKSEIEQREVVLVAAEVRRTK